MDTQSVNMDDDSKYGPIIIDDLDCLGHETDVSECRAKEWNIHDCSKTEAVVIKCGNNN